MDFNTGLFRRPTKSWSTHQLNSIHTEASQRLTQQHDRVTYFCGCHDRGVIQKILVYKYKKPTRAYDTINKISWKIIAKAKAYSNTTRRCNLCVTKKFFILSNPQMASLNKCNELISNCRHRRKYILKYSWNFVYCYLCVGVRRKTSKIFHQFGHGEVRLGELPCHFIPQMRALFSLYDAEFWSFKTLKGLKRG